MAELDTSVLARPSPSGLRLDTVVAAIGRRAGAIASLLALLVAWEAASRSGVVTPFLLPPLSAVLGRVWEDALSGDLVLNLGQTLYRALAGFAIAGIGGIAIGILEKLLEIYWGQPLMGGNTETWFAFVFALIVLLFRPQGLFGEKIIERI